MATTPETTTAPPAPDALTARDIDVIYQETDRLYYELARGCGLSDSAYWILYDVLVDGGGTSLRRIGEDHCLSRQTVSSSVKSLEARGLVRLEYEEGSRRNKRVVLTDGGRAFCERLVEPAMQAEERAFRSLPEPDRREFVRLVRAYADAVDAELRALRAEGQGGDAR